MFPNKKAFTLIELLVVIAIIAILTTLAVFAINNARSKARDAKRVADIKRIQTALELFYNDAERYPLTSEFVAGDPLQYNDGYGTSTYMKILPAAPQPHDGDCSTTTNAFVYNSDNGNTYTINFCLGGRVSTLGPGQICASPIALETGACQ